jgi:hypothetical protein
LAREITRNAREIRTKARANKSKAQAFRVIAPAFQMIARAIEPNARVNQLITCAFHPFARAFDRFARAKKTFARAAESLSGVGNPAARDFNPQASAKSPKTCAGELPTNVVGVMIYNFAVISFAGLALIRVREADRAVEQPVDGFCFRHKNANVRRYFHFREHLELTAPAKIGNRLHQKRDLALADVIMLFGVALARVPDDFVGRVDQTQVGFIKQDVHSEFPVCAPKQFAEYLVKLVGREFSFESNSDKTLCFGLSDRPSHS